jgi:ABC-type uncharacterized transport system permease subunit
MPDIVMQLLPHILATALYGGLGYHFWRTRWREGENRRVSRPMQTWERLAIACALVPHAAGLRSAIFTAEGMHFSFALALSLMLWLAALLYWLESFMARMEGMQPMILPLASAAAALPVIFPDSHLIAHAASSGFRLHFLTAMLAYSLLTLSALQAIFMGFTENALHRHALTRSLASLPPLLTMERLLFRMIGLGFILLSLTVGSGVFFSEQLFGKPFSLDHKTIFALASWALFATLLVGRHIWGWRGKRALRLTLTAFGLLILAYIGSRFVAEVILHRS